MLTDLEAILKEASTFSSPFRALKALAMNFITLTALASISNDVSEQGSKVRKACYPKKFI